MSFGDLKELIIEKKRAVLDRFRLTSKQTRRHKEHQTNQGLEVAGNPNADKHHVTGCRKTREDDSKHLIITPSSRRAELTTCRQLSPAIIATSDHPK